MNLIDSVLGRGINASVRTLGLRTARLGGAIGFAALLLAAPAGAVERVLELVAPATAKPLTRIEVSVRASTDAGAKEQIGFLHVEYSIDGGKTWRGLCYEQSQGTKAVRPLGVVTGAAGTKVLVRARAAYRGGAAGDVDFSGAAIKWQGSWDKWSEPPARLATVEVN
jgi:hypothetical protein